MTMQTPATAEI